MSRQKGKRTLSHQELLESLDTDVRARVEAYLEKDTEYFCRARRLLAEADREDIRRGIEVLKRKSVGSEADGE